MNRIGIRLEDKNEWERRVPLTPPAVAGLTAQGIDIAVQRFPRRAYPDGAFAEAGATLVDDVSACDLVLGIKEMPVSQFRPNGAYFFFSHTIKGQPYNMEMLADLVNKRCTLFDYEVVRDEKNRRLIFFGRFAGIAGMIDTLWTLGRRLDTLGQANPFASIHPAHHYPHLEAAQAAISAVGARIAREGLPESLCPFVVGITGYGNVSKGTQEILDLLPHREVAPGDLAAFLAANPKLDREVVKVVYHEEHIVTPVDPSRPFQLQDYYDHPERYRSTFGAQLPLLSVLVNGIFWTEKYPRLASKEQLADLFEGPRPPRLLVVGDISCDVNGSLACTVRDTEPGDPVYVYDPVTGQAPSGSTGPGLAVMAVSNLPCELPVEASATFSDALTPFMPALARVDFNAAFEAAQLPDPLRRAAILWRGEFTPEFRYMRDFLR